MDEDEMERRIEKMATEMTRPERAVFNLHVPPARTAIDLAPALDDSLKPRVRGGAVVMEPVGSEAVRRVLERHQPMLGLHGHIHESRGTVRLGRTLSINPGSEEIRREQVRSESTGQAGFALFDCPPAIVRGNGALVEDAEAGAGIPGGS
jgi:Icc-related predicted phosphoesterase